jgi:hypothetical protein
MTLGRRLRVAWIALGYRTDFFPQKVAGLAYGLTTLARWRYRQWKAGL